MGSTIFPGFAVAAYEDSVPQDTFPGKTGCVFDTFSGNAGCALELDAGVKSCMNRSWPIDVRPPEEKIHRLNLHFSALLLNK